LWRILRESTGCPLGVFCASAWDVADASLSSKLIVVIHSLAALLEAEHERAAFRFSIAAYGGKILYGVFLKKVYYVIHLSASK
jgi:hypothetical protein